MNHGSLLHHGTVMTSPKEALELRDEIIHLANEVSTLPVWQGALRGDGHVPYQVKVGL